MQYVSVKDIAERWGVSRRRVQVLCAENRIPGAYLIGRTWIIPSSAKKPLDARSLKRNCWHSI